MKPKSKFMNGIDIEYGLPDYLFIRNYLQNNIIARGISFKLNLDNLDLINVGNKYESWDNQSKKVFKHIIQIKLITDVMMLLEDLGSFSKVFMENKKKELLKNVLNNGSSDAKNFYKKVNKLSDENFLDIMNLPTYDLLEKERSIEIDDKK